jgi:hypothetical protein
MACDQTPFRKLYHNTNYESGTTNGLSLKKLEGLSTVVDHFSGAGGVAENA